MTLADHQQSYRGLTLGSGTGYRLFQVDGLEDLIIRDGDRDAPRDDGGIPGSHYAAQKVVVLTYRISETTAEDLETLLAGFYAAFTRRELTQDEFVFKFPGQDERMIRARPLRRSRPRTRVGTVAKAVELAVAMKTTDPRIYSTTQQQALVPIFSATFSGFDLPVVNLPINMSAAVLADETVLAGGSSEAFPVMQFQYVSGTVTGLLVTNLTNGSTFEMGPDPQSTAFALTSGQTLIVDMDAIVRKVPDEDPIRIDTSSQYTFWQMPRAPFYLSPGFNTLTFEPSGTLPVVTALVQWRDTHL